MTKFGVNPKKEEALKARMARFGVKESDLVEYFIRSSGPGGQNVNKVATGVYLRHVPTGIEVKCMLERSQALNRFRARRTLLAKIEEMILGKESAERKRIEKIRRQKRKRSKRAKEKILKDKRARSEKKAMRRAPARDILLVLLLATMISGCATMHYPSAYKVEGQEFKKFKELDDDKALKVVALIYNVNHDEWEDSMARSLALEEYLNLLRKRKSKYIKGSGIFDIKYDKVKISRIKDRDLIKLYKALAPKADNYYMDSSQELTERENARRIVYLTAMGSIATEMKKRDNTRNAMSIASQVLLTAITVALQMI